MASVSGYNHHRFARSVLKKSRKWEASLTVELHNAHWKFHNSTMCFPYDHPLRPFLLALRSQVIPAALLPFLYEIQPPIAFVDGCLVVQVNDYRRSPEPVFSRVVMRPAAEGLAQTIDMAMQLRGEPWDEQFALEAESRIINTTSSPLYLGTSPVAARNANLALSLTAPAHSSQSADGRLRDPHTGTSTSSELDLGVGTAADRMRALLRATDRPSARQPHTPSSGPAAFTPNWLILRAKESYEAALRHKEKELTREARAAAQAAQQAALGAAAGASVPPAAGEGANATATNGAAGTAPADGAEGAPPPAPTPAKPKPKKPKKRPAAAADEDAQKEAPPTAASAASAATAATTAAPTTNPAPAKKKKTAAMKKAEIETARAAQAAADEAAANGTALPAGSTGAAAAVAAATTDIKPVVGAAAGDGDKPKPKPKGRKKGAKAEE